MTRGGAGAAALLAVCFGCSSPTPTKPRASTPASAEPAPTPSPSPGSPPAPVPEPSSTPEPDIDPSACPSPKPPPLARVDVKILIVGASRLILDSTPIVGPDPDYCRAIGYSDGRRYCPPRPEGDPERADCEALLVGHATDTNRYGPTWTANERACVEGATRPPFCGNHPENQFLVFAYGAGMFEACSRSGVCGGVRIQ